MSFDQKLFSGYCKAARQGKSLRWAARESEVSASTISRIERGASPDMDSFLKLCQWLSVCPSRFIAADSVEESNEDELDRITDIILASSRIDPTTQKVLISLIKAAYDYHAIS